MDSLFDMVKKLMMATEIDDATVEKSWTQVGKLRPEDEGRRRAVFAAAAERKREHEMYAKKMAALKAMNAAEADEWWHHVHKTYGLPQGDYHIHDDSRIFARPQEKKNAPTE